MVSGADPGGAWGHRVPPRDFDYEVINPYVSAQYVHRFDRTVVYQVLVVNYVLLHAPCLSSY